MLRQRRQDFIWINAGAVSGSVTVNVNGESHGTFAPSGRIVVNGGAGNDTIALHPDLALDAWLFGGEGDDVLISADGNDVLSGGAGADWLWANRGRDLLFGGTGLDHLDGGNEEDILISGTSAYETDEVALAAIMAEWTSPRDFVTRQRNLRHGSGAPIG
jgi:Ca2+-binding RTX toxin-like protein